MNEKFRLPRRHDFSDFDDVSLESTVTDSPVARSPSSVPALVHKKEVYNKSEIDSFAVDSDEDSCITNYDLKQLFFVTKSILETDQEVIKSIPNTGLIKSETSLDSTMTKEESHILQSQTMEKEITTAVDKLAYGHDSCKELLTPTSNKRSKHESAIRTYTQQDIANNYVNPGNVVNQDDTDEGIISKLMDVFCCNMNMKDFAI